MVVEKYALIIQSRRYDEDEDGWEGALALELNGIGFRNAVVSQDTLLESNPSLSHSFFVVVKKGDIELDILHRLYSDAFIIVICESESDAKLVIDDEKVGFAMVGFSPAYRAGVIQKLYALSLHNFCRND